MHYDVIVVGAGPGGSTAARRCALNGLKTLLIEKEKLPRYKPCGGAVSAKALSLLDFSIKKELIERECYGARFHYGEHNLEVKKPYMLGIISSRDKLDMYLTEKAIDAGAELRDSEQMRSLNATKEGISIKTDHGNYKASIVVGADGVNSTVSSYLGGGFKPSELALTLETKIPLTEDNITDPEVMQIYYGFVSSGYGWVFPKKDHLSVGLGWALTESKKPREVFTNFLKKLNLDTNSQPRPYLIPCWSKDRATYSDRILLVGDAAGFVDPFLGEGVSHAINSGKIASDAILTAYERDDFSKNGLKRYDTLCHNAFKGYLRDARRMFSLTHRYPQIFLKMLTYEKSLAGKSFEVMAGRIDYKEFRKWLLLRIPYYCIRSMFL